MSSGLGKGPFYTPTPSKNLTDRKVEEMPSIQCLHCGKDTSYPANERGGYGEIFICPHCEALYFVEMPEDVLETLQEIAQTHGLKLSYDELNKFDIKKMDNFDSLVDEEGEEDGEVYTLYSVKLPN